MRVVVCLGLSVVPALLRAQSATGVLDVEQLTSYDSRTDSTHLAVVTHKGTYFLWIQHPRLTWTMAYPGRAPDVRPPGEILLVFRTQDPQSPTDNHLVIESASGERLELNSVNADTRPGPMTQNLYMNFLIPTAELARSLAGDNMRLTVGGIGVKFKREQMDALRALLSQAGAGVPGEAPGESPGGEVR
jgi:hypothetical protein